VYAQSPEVPGAYKYSVLRCHRLAIYYRIVTSLFANNRASLEGFLVDWDQYKRDEALKHLTDALGQDEPSKEKIKSAYDQDKNALATMIRSKLEPTCDWSRIEIDVGYQRVRNYGYWWQLSDTFTRGGPFDQAAYDFLCQLLGDNQRSKSNFEACTRVNAPRVACFIRGVCKSNQ
jgi:hypothetical protein